MACKRCQDDPQPRNFGSPRRCAFDSDGNFTPDNWNCATINTLTETTEDRLGGPGGGPQWETIYGCDESLNIAPGASSVEGDSDWCGWIVLSRYKTRGCCSSAIWVGDFFPPKPVTLDLVERAIAQLLGDPFLRS